MSLAIHLSVAVHKELLGTALVDRPSNTNRVITTLLFVLAYSLRLVLILALILGTHIKTNSPPLARDLAPPWLALEKFGTKAGTNPATGIIRSCWR